MSVFYYIIYNLYVYSRSLSGTSGSWLATQQRKLVERREAGRRADRGRQEARVMTELRNRIGQVGWVGGVSVGK